MSENLLAVIEAFQKSLAPDQYVKWLDEVCQKLGVDPASAYPIRRAVTSEPEKCDDCGTELTLRGCGQCGAPVCCPKCCREQAMADLKQENADLRGINKGLLKSIQKKSGTCPKCDTPRVAVVLCPTCDESRLRCGPPPINPRE